MNDLNIDSIYEKQPVEDFEWPCHRRDAHHAHPLPGVHAYIATAVWAGDKKKVRCDTCGGKKKSPIHDPESKCPGVQAHPQTMSGSVYRLIES